MSSIYHRTSVRKYEDRTVEKDKIREILRAGMQAPSAGNQQPWEFYVVTDKEKIKALSGVSPYAGAAAGASVVIVPAYRKQGLVFPESRKSTCPLHRKICGCGQTNWDLAACGWA
jgi:nitroreductase